MEIIGKEFRCKRPLVGEIENDVQGGTHSFNQYIYIYIYNQSLAPIYFSNEKKMKLIDEFGKVPVEKRRLKLKNLNRLVEEKTLSTTIREYKILDDRRIQMKMFNQDTKELELSFEGEILLCGDAIKGVFYRGNGRAMPSRVYYNIDKPLPDPLIPEDNDEIV